MIEAIREIIISSGLFNESDVNDVIIDIIGAGSLTLFGDAVKDECWDLITLFGSITKLIISKRFGAEDPLYFDTDSVKYKKGDHND